jgi:hypothetical protein
MTAHRSALLPPAMRARRIALTLSLIAVAFSLPAGFCARSAFALRTNSDAALPWALAFLVLLLFALLFRMGAAIGELVWLERTWSNLPDAERVVGPVRDVSSGLAIAMNFVPGVAWVWKLGVVLGIARGFESMRPRFDAPVPKRLGVAAVIIGWVPGLNVYFAPFLWELFARRIDVCVNQIISGGRT